MILTHLIKFFFDKVPNGKGSVTLTVAALYNSISSSSQNGLLSSVNILNTITVSNSPLASSSLLHQNVATTTVKKSNVEVSDE